MKYVVIVTPEAQSNIAAAYEYIAQHSPASADKWLLELYKKIDGLEQYPRRFGYAREQAHFADEIRQLVFKSHRIIFTIDDSMRTVHVAFVRHARMRSVGEPATGTDSDGD